MRPPSSATVAVLELEEKQKERDSMPCALRTSPFSRHCHRSPGSYRARATAPDALTAAFMPQLAVFLPLMDILKKRLHASSGKRMIS